MDELLKKLMESEVLSDESKTELTEAFQAKIAEAVELATKETEVKVRAELTEQFVEEKQAIVEALDTKAEQFLRTHLEELQEDIATFRDLEADFAARLVEEKQAIAETVKRDMAELIDQLDAFNTQCLEEEFAELEDSIKEVKQLQFGKEIFEAVAKTFESKFTDSNETLNQLKEAKAELEQTQVTLAEVNKSLHAVKRDQKLSEVLEPLQGLSREIMETILKTAPTEKLEETYEKFIGRVLHDASNKKSEKESAQASVLAEGNEETVVTEGTVVVTGDTPAINETEVTDRAKLSESVLSRLNKLAGIDD
jgi:hypothetical protein